MTANWAAWVALVALSAVLTGPLTAWTAAVLVARTLRGRPVGLRVVARVVAAGLHLHLVALVVPSGMAVTGAAVASFPFLLWPDLENRLGIRLGTVSAVGGAIVGGLTALLLVPTVTRHEWRRLTAKRREGTAP